LLAEELAEQLVVAAEVLAEELADTEQIQLTLIPV
tara:strand:+ start:108 stop:212 length:105 start_codon:yes stop_codon:yes gene_type:complete